MKRICIALAAGIALAGSPAVPVLAEGERPFEAAGPWRIDYGSQSCRLVRDFSDGTDTLSLGFERFLPGPGLRLVVAGDRELARRGTTARFRYGPAGAEQRQKVYASTLSDGRPALVLRSAALLERPSAGSPAETEGAPFSFFVGEELSAAEQVDSLRFTRGVRGNPVVILGPMRKPVEALQSCIADLMRDWGLDMEQMVRMSRQAEPERPPQSWMDSADYPPEMLRQGRQGVVEFRLVVDERGQIATCHVDLDTPGPFGEATCNAIRRRARFKPALDADGKPMRALYVCSVDFRFA